MKSYLKFLSRNKLYTFINVFGLSISLMFVILIANYVVRCFTMDSNVQNKERIYTVSNEDYIGTGFWIGQKLKDKYPQIEEACAVVGDEGLQYKIGENEYKAISLFVDTTFIRMFSVEVIKGDAKTLVSKENVFISRGFANKVFGNSDPLGKTVKVLGNDSGDREVIISGVFENISNSVFPDADVLLNSLNIGNYNQSITREHMDNAGATTIFVIAREGVDLNNLESDVCDYFKTFFWPYSGGASKIVDFIPFNDIYFSDKMGETLRHGEWSFVLILISVGFLIMLFAIVNYINLTVAQTGFRAKEMATRRLLGSSRKALFGKLIGESLFMCVIAFVVGFFLAVVAESTANELLGSEISITGDMNALYISGYALLIILMAFISGLFPAIIISKYKPIEVVRGTLRRKTNMVYGKILIVFQSVITIALIAGSIAMSLQIKHLINAPMGYNMKDILHQSAWSYKSRSDIFAVYDGLKALPCVDTVSLCMGYPLNGGNNNTIQYGPEKMVSFQTFIGDSNFDKLLGLKIIYDNKSNGGWYLNEYAFKELGIDQSALDFSTGKDMSRKLQIQGVMKDFHVRSALREPTSTRVLIIDNFANPSPSDTLRVGSKPWPWDILIKINGNPDEAYVAVNGAIAKVTGTEDNGLKYVEDENRDNYADMERTEKIVLIFTVIAIIISSLGLLAMSTYYIQQRRMEIAVRKVFGSTRTQVLKRIVGNFMKLTAIAFVLSLPIIWYVISWWLSHYSYRILLSPLIFVAAGIFAALIAFITVYWQSGRAAAENPVDAVKR